MFASDLPDFIKLLRGVSKLPIAVGFGVKSRKDVQSLARIADIVIAGSVFVNMIKNSSDKITSVLEKTARSLAN